MDGNVDQAVLDEVIRHAAAAPQPEKMIPHGSTVRDRMTPQQRFRSASGAAQSRRLGSSGDRDRYREGYGMVIRDAIERGTSHP